MRAEEIETRELEALYDEKRDKLNQRLPVWSLLVGLFSLFGYAGIQPGIAGYVVVLYPLLSACVARFAGHSERVLNRVKQRIYKIEEQAGYHGYEHENKEVSGSQPHRSGAHAQALRDVILLTDLVALTAIVARLIVDHLPALVIPVMLLEVAAMAAVWFWMADTPAHQTRKTTQAPTQTEKRSNSLLRNGLTRNSPTAAAAASVPTQAGRLERRRRG